MSKEVEARRQEHEAELNAELEGAHRERGPIEQAIGDFSCSNGVGS